MDIELAIGNFGGMMLSITNEIGRGVVTRGSEGSADPPDFGKSKKLSHKNAIKSEFPENWGQIGLSDPPDFWSLRRPWEQIKLWIWMYFLLQKRK